MARTLILYESKYGTSKETAEIIGRLLSMSKCRSVDEAPDDLHFYENVVFVFSMYGSNTAQKIKEYISNDTIRCQLSEKKIGAVGVGFWMKNFPEHLRLLEEMLQREVDRYDLVWGRITINRLTKEDSLIVRSFCEKIGVTVGDRDKFYTANVISVAEQFMEEWNIPEEPLEPEIVMDEVRQFLKQHNTCALATGAEQFVRCTPIEYHFIDDQFYLVSEGGFKFKGILLNQRVSLAVFDAFSGWEQLGGLQVTGDAELMQEDGQEYGEILEKMGLSPEKLNEMPVDLHLIRIIPRRYEFLNAAFKEKEADIRQKVDLIEL